MATRKAYKIVALVELALLLVAGGVAIGFWWKGRKQSRLRQEGYGECTLRVRQLATAALHYAENHDQRLPESLEALVAQQGWDKSILVPTLVQSPHEPAFDYLLPGEHLELVRQFESTPLLRAHHTTNDGRRIVAFLDGHVELRTDDQSQALRLYSPDHRILAGLPYPAAKFLVERAGLSQTNRWPFLSVAYDMATDVVELQPGEWLVIGHSLSRDDVTALAICTPTKNRDDSDALVSQTIRSIEFPPDHSAIVQCDLPAKPVTLEQAGGLAAKIEYSPRTPARAAATWDAGGRGRRSRA